MEATDCERKRGSKRPLSFSEDSYEWDSIRAKIPPNVGWNSIKCDCDIFSSASEFPVKWVPYGYVDDDAQKDELRQTEASITVTKKTMDDTISKLEEGKEREVATEIVSAISEHAGSFELENLDEEAFSRILPFPSEISDERMSLGDKWQFDQSDCQMESLLSRDPEACPSLSFPAWKAAKRRQRKFEVSKVDRDVKKENVQLKDGEFCWTTFANSIKPLFMAMEPKARCIAANYVAEYLKGDT